MYNPDNLLIQDANGAHWALVHDEFWTTLDLYSPGHYAIVKETGLVVPRHSPLAEIDLYVRVSEAIHVSRPIEEVIQEALGHIR